MNAYAEEIHELEQVCTPTKWLSVILYDRYEKEYLNKVMIKPMKNLIEVKRNELLKLL